MSRVVAVDRRAAKTWRHPLHCNHANSAHRQQRSPKRWSLHRGLSGSATSASDLLTGGTLFARENSQQGHLTPTKCYPLRYPKARAITIFRRTMSPRCCFYWSWRTDSNRRPADYKSAALPTELRQRREGRRRAGAGYRSRILCELRRCLNRRGCCGCETAGSCIPLSGRAAQYPLGARLRPALTGPMADGATRRLRRSGRDRAGRGRGSAPRGVQWPQRAARHRRR